MRDYKIGDVIQLRNNPTRDHVISSVSSVHVIVDSGFRALGKASIRPKYWYVKRPDNIDDPIWLRISQYIRTNSCWVTFDFVDKDKHYIYFGYDGNKHYTNGFNCYQTTHNFQNNAFELTPEEWDKFDYDGLNRTLLQNQYRGSNVYMNVYMETKETVTISRRDLVALNGRAKFMKCNECKEVVHYYLDIAKYMLDDTNVPIEQRHLDMIPRLTDEQRKILSEYVKFPKVDNFKLAVKDLEYMMSRGAELKYITVSTNDYDKHILIRLPNANRHFAVNILNVILYIMLRQMANH